VQAEVFGINVALLLVLCTQLDAGAGALLSLMALVNGLFIAAIIGVFCGSLSRRGRSALPVCVAALAACLVSASFDAGLLRLGTWRIAEAVRLLSDGVDLRYIVDAGVRSVGATEIGTALALPMLSLAVAASSITRAYLADRPAPVLLGSPETPQALLATDLTPSGSLMRE